MGKTVLIPVNKYGCRGLWSGLAVVESDRKRGKHHAANQAKKDRGVAESNGGQPIVTRTIPRGLNHRCSCGGGKKSRNCCRSEKGK